MKQTPKVKTPWPTQAVMAQIYEQNLWGGNATNFYSGEGSHDPAIVKPYIDCVSAFLQEFDEPIIVCDLGCGDFNVGKELVPFSKKYIGVDIVPALIERNKELFQFENLNFQCLDVAKHELPSGDCALVRQVLQHLSNDEVKLILEKLSNYQYVIITEHIPLGDFIPNKNKITSQGIRLKHQSGIDVMEAPFNWNVCSSKEMTSIMLEKGKGRIVTTLYTVF